MGYETRILSAALTFGVDTDWVKTNPAKKAKLTPADRNKDPILTTDQLFEMVATALDEDQDMAVALYLAAATGCRRGELCGLRWNDLDVERGTLRVERQWVTGQGGQHLVEIAQDRRRSDGESRADNGQGHPRLPEGQGHPAWPRAGWLAPLVQRRPERDAEQGNGRELRFITSRRSSSYRRRSTLSSHWKDATLNQLGVDLPTGAAQRATASRSDGQRLSTHERRTGSCSARLAGNGVLDGAMDVTALERALPAD